MYGQMAAVGVIFTLPGLALIWAGATNVLREEIALHDCRPVQAEILAAGIKERTSRKGNIVSAPQITYRYEINGKTYTSDRVNFTPIYMSGSYGSDIANCYKPGQKTTAYVLAKDDQSVLSRDLGFAYFGLVLFGILFLSVGAAIIVFGCRYSKTAPVEEAGEEPWTKPVYRRKERHTFQSTPPPVQPGAQAGNRQPVAAIVQVTIFSLGGLATFALYYGTAPAPFSPASYIVAPIWAAVSIFLAALVFRRARQPG